MPSVICDPEEININKIGSNEVNPSPPFLMGALALLLMGALALHPSYIVTLHTSV